MTLDDRSLTAPSSSSFVAEARLVEVAGRRAPAADQIGPRLVDRDARVGIEHAGAKLDRRQMALAHGTQAHDEAHRAARKAALIRRRHDRWVEQRSGLDRVLVREVGPDQQAALGRHRGGIGDVRARRASNCRSSISENADGAPSNRCRICRVQRCHFALRNRQDPGHQQMRARLAGQQRLLARQVGLGEHAAGVGQEAMASTRDRGWTSCRTRRAIVAVVVRSSSSPASSSILSSDSKKQIVLSAPWFRLTSATPMPSRQPPVAKSYNGTPSRLAPRNHANDSRMRRK